jgi:hypothetical protein
MDHPSSKETIPRRSDLDLLLGVVGVVGVVDVVSVVDVELATDAVTISLSKKLSSSLLGDWSVSVYLVVLCTSVLLFFHCLLRGGECCSGDFVSISEDENSEQKLEVSTSSSAVNAVTLFSISPTVLCSACISTWVRNQVKMYQLVSFRILEAPHMLHQELLPNNCSHSEI